MTESKSAELTAEGAALAFAAVADPTRLGIIRQLAHEGATCVCNIALAETVAPNLLSYHLKVLRDAGLVNAVRRGRWIDYSVTPGAIERLHAALPTSSPS